MVFDSSVSSRVFAIGAIGSVNLTLEDNASPAPDAVVLTIGGNNQSTTASSILSGSGGLVKTGSGSFFLSGSNSYTGGTTVAGGTLTAAATGSLPGYAAAGSVSVLGGATLAVCPTNTWTAAAINALLNGGPALAAGANIGFDTRYGSFSYPDSIANPSAARWAC